jgi:hypothetical protein
MTKHLEQVRKAIANFYWVSSIPGDRNLSVEAQAALSAHEEEVRELVEAARDALCELRDRSDAKKVLIGVIAKFQGEKE